ncbi:response regulator [Sinomicrobium sp. M5D2P17]
MTEKANNYNIVLIDDHPLITKVFRDTLKGVAREDLLVFNIVEVHSCDEALTLFGKLSSLYRIDMVFLDLQLPPSSDGEMISGEDLGLSIRERSPDTKIIIVTAFNDPYRIHTLLENINPDGFLVKNDLEPEELPTIIRHLIQDPPYYSATVAQALRPYMAHHALLDKIDRHLLHELSLGATLSHMVTVLPLSRSAIVKRKQRLKEYFDIRGGDDRELIRKAHEKGFV